MEDRLLLSEDGPRLRSRRRLAWGTFIAVTLIFAVGVGVGIASRSVDPFGILMFAFPLVGIFVLTRQPTNRIGWITTRWFPCPAEECFSPRGGLTAISRPRWKWQVQGYAGLVEF